MKKIILLAGLVIPLSLLSSCSTATSQEMRMCGKKEIPVTQQCPQDAAGATATMSNQSSNIKPASKVTLVKTPKIDQKQLGKAIHNYLVSHPGILDEMIAARQKKQEVAMQGTAGKVAKGLMSDADAPSVGTAKPTTTVIEYFDYQCSACKAAWPELATAINNPDNKNVRFVFAELPFFPGSRYAAEVSLAAYKLNPKNFEKFHANMMKFKEKSEGTLTKEQVMQVASKSGYSSTDIQSFVTNHKTQIEQELTQNEQSFGKIGFRGTPSFVIINNNTDKVEVSPGVPSNLQEIISNVTTS